MVQVKAAVDSLVYCMVAKGVLIRVKRCRVKTQRAGNSNITTSCYMKIRSHGSIMDTEQGA